LKRCVFTYSCKYNPAAATAAVETGCHAYQLRIPHRLADVRRQLNLQDVSHGLRALHSLHELVSEIALTALLVRFPGSLPRSQLVAGFREQARLLAPATGHQPKLGKSRMTVQRYEQVRDLTVIDLVRIRVRRPAHAVNQCEITAYEKQKCAIVRSCKTRLRQIT
jgi:hypothetical protein